MYINKHLQPMERRLVARRRLDARRLDARRLDEHGFHEHSSYHTRWRLYFLHFCKCVDGAHILAPWRVQSETL